VKIDHPFYMGKFEVTQGQWKKVMGENPSVFQGDRIKEGDPDRYPVDNVTWDDTRVPHETERDGKGQGLPSADRI
jgi:formylglycine-generating enzyme required for sulfatase activity